MIEDGWIHCNKCFREPTTESPGTYFLTTCGHILCGDCTEGAAGADNQTQRCPCGTEGYKTQPLNKETPEQVRNFFADTSAKIAHLQSQIMFQRQHCSVLINHKRELLEQARAEKEQHEEEARKIKELIQAKRLKLKALAAQEERLTRQLNSLAGREASASRVSVTPSNPSVHNSSQYKLSKWVVNSKTQALPAPQRSSGSVGSGRSHLSLPRLVRPSAERSPAPSLQRKGNVPSTR